MDETTVTLSKLRKTQAAIYERLRPEAKVAFAMEHIMGKLTLNEQIAETERWHHEATHDRLTGALNIAGLEEYLETATYPRAVLYTDATNFKAVNDMYGHSIGNDLIKKTFDVFRTSLRAGDVIVRLGGDEFAAILNGDEQSPKSPDHPMAHEFKLREKSAVENIDEATARVAQQVQDLLEDPAILDDAGQKIDLKIINFNLAVGGAVWEGDVNFQQFMELVKRAEGAAMADKALQHQQGRYRSTES